MTTSGQFHSITTASSMLLFTRFRLQLEKKNVENKENRK